MWKKALEQMAKSAKASGGRGPPPPAAIGAAATVAFGGFCAFQAYNSLFTVEGGHRAVMFSRLSGISNEVLKEGTHFRIPWLQQPVIFNVRTKPKTVRSPTGTRDLQTVDITMRVLYKPDANSLPLILSTIGEDYPDKVLPSLINETLKSVVAQFNASQLITKRSEVSEKIKRNLTERGRDFNIIIDDVAITHLTFGKEYAAAVEAKQIAQQESERAKYLVKQALQDQKSTVIKAQGEAESAEMIGKAIQGNPGYIQLRRLDAARNISETVSQSRNKVYLNSDNLLLNLLQQGDEKLTAGGD